MSKLFLNYKEKKLFRLSIKKTKRSRRGDFDIMIDVGNKMVFEKVVAGNYFRVFENQVNALSWHGFYEERSDGVVLIPIVHFKKKNGAQEELRHFGAIDIEEPIPVPICSVYIPKNVNIENLGRSGVSRTANFVIDIDPLLEEDSVRFDFFVFPDGVDIDAFKKSEASFIFSSQGVDVFNNGGELSSPEEGLNVSYHMLNDGENILVRYVCNPVDMFSNLNNTFSLVVHEPNDVYNILNRVVCGVNDDGEIVNYGSMKELHKERMI